MYRYTYLWCSDSHPRVWMMSLIAESEMDAGWHRCLTCSAVKCWFLSVLKPCSIFNSRLHLYRLSPTFTTLLVVYDLTVLLVILWFDYFMIWVVCGFTRKCICGLFNCSSEYKKTCSNTHREREGAHVTISLLYCSWYAYSVQVSSSHDQFSALLLQLTA